MKLTAINGSPKPHGNTSTVLDAFLKGAESAGAETVQITLAKTEYKNCRGCNACHKDGVCIITDDFTKVFGEVMAADVLVLASPIYSMTVTAEMKAFIDRGQFLWAQKFITKTLGFSKEHLARHTGIYLATSGQNIPGIFDAAYPVVRAFFNDAGFSYTENVTFPGMDEHGSVKNWPEAVTDAERRGKEITEKFLHLEQCSSA
jgi:multimeric flavodoxin WrbA